MAEYIDREKVLLETCGGCTRQVDLCCRHPEPCERLIDAFLTTDAADVVPVVRCRECKHYRENITKKYGNLICRCTRMGKYDMDYPVRPDDFCSRGERK